MKMLSFVWLYFFGVLTLFDIFIILNKFNRHNSFDKINKFLISYDYHEHVLLYKLNEWLKYDRNVILSKCYYS